jgi:two-component system, OmpR family, alkaline phosphatase synthesis response regulator PhoP
MAPPLRPKGAPPVRTGSSTGRRIGRYLRHREEPQLRILVIDDEPDVLLLCRVNLQFDGHEVLEASDGDAGFQKAVAERPDLIVLDVMMPRRDGFSVLQELREKEETKDIPVILLTARAQEDDQVRGWLAGAAEYVTKPFSPSDLTDVVRGVLAMSPEERAARRSERLRRLTILEQR